MLSPRALYQEVADRLREKIFARELEPGAWIDELKLAAEWGISRTPLREALKVLAVEGLVTMKVRRGAYVTEMSRDDVSQVYRLLALLERTEQPRHHLRLDSNPIVDHLNLQIRPIHSGSDDNLASDTGELPGIAQQVAHHLPQTDRVGPDIRLGRIKV